MKTLFDRQIQFHQTALNLQAHRQQLIASNIANADTPHYKARDVDFRAALQGALATAREGVQMATTQAGHIASAPAPSPRPSTGCARPRRWRCAPPPISPKSSGNWPPAGLERN